MSESARTALRSTALNLPHATALEAVQTDPCIELVPLFPDGYVWPDSNDVEGSSPCSILLVTAAGAMGKSMAARALASEIGAPLIDLGKLRVGSDSLTGLLTRVLGWEQAPTFVRKLKEGAVALVLDGLDEALLASGREHYFAFLSNIADLVKDGAKASQIIAFGRRDAVDTTFLAFDDLDVSSKIASILPLSLTQALNLVDLTLDARKIDGVTYAVHRQHPGPFGELRDRVLLNIAHALGAIGDDLESIWFSVDDFLGYPPVLLVLAEHLAVDNPSAAYDRADLGVRASRDIAQRGVLLQKIVEGILDREQAKVQSQMLSVLELSAEQAGVIYQREEQVVRIIGHISTDQLAIVPPAILKPADLRIYNDQITTFVPDHPFLRGRMLANGVFSDYLRGYVVTTPLSEVFGIGDEHLLASCAPIGPFFTYFVHALSSQATRPQDDSESSTPWVRERHVDALLKSHIAGSVTVPMMFVGIDADDLDGSKVMLGSEHEPLPYFTFRVVDVSGILELESPLSHCFIYSNGGVVISSRSPEVELGNRLVISADEIEILGSRVTASGGERDRVGSVILTARSVRHKPNVTVRAFPESALWIYWPNTSNAWRPYLMEVGRLPEVDPTKSLQVFAVLRRLLRSFHQSKVSAPTIYREALDNLVVGSSPIFRASLQALQELDLVVVDQNNYRLNLDELGRYGVNWAAINSPDFETALKRLHERVCANRGVLALIKYPSAPPTDEQ